MTPLALGAATTAVLILVAIWEDPLVQEIMGTFLDA